MCLRLIAETDARSVGDSHPSCWWLVVPVVGLLHVYYAPCDIGGTLSIGLLQFQLTGKHLQQ